MSSSAGTDLVVVLEAKLTSANDRQTKDLERFDRYLRHKERWAASSDQIKSAGLYELVRNWEFAWELADRVGATYAVLGNLAPTGYHEEVETFGTLLAQSSTRRVAHVRWADVLPDPIPAWLGAYVERLGLATL